MDRFIAGVDEAGRGPLAGSVIAAAVILDPSRPIKGLTDSKLLTEKKREALFEQIRLNALSWSVARARVREIDDINILQASLLAMQRAVAGLSIKPHEILVDGNRAPLFDVPARAIIGGDLLEASISAASIVAKVLRDRYMVFIDRYCPEYGFAKHKGYGTKVHCEALKSHGVTRWHRSSFAPVTALLSIKKPIPI